MKLPFVLHRTTEHLSRVRIAAVIMIALLAMVCAGFMFTMIIRSGFWQLLSFGFIGVVVFVQSFPWLILAAFIALDMWIAALVRTFAHSRNTSLPLLCVALVTLTLGGGLLLSWTPLYAGWQPPPAKRDSMIDPIIRGYGAWRFHNLFPGTISEIREHGYVILGPDGRAFVIDVMPGTQFPEGRDFAIGDGVLVIGSAKKESIRAFGIRPFTPPNPAPKNK